MNIFRQFEIKKNDSLNFLNYNVSLEVPKIMNLSTEVSFYLNSLYKFKKIFFLYFKRSFNV